MELILLRQNFYLPQHLNSNEIRKVFQNQFAHDWLTGGQSKWFEADASYKGMAYFDKYYGRGKDGYVAGSPEYFDRNSFVSGDLSPYINPRIGASNTSIHPTGSKFHGTDISIYIPLLGLISAIFY